MKTTFSQSAKLAQGWPRFWTVLSTQGAMQWLRGNQSVLPQAPKACLTGFRDPKGAEMNWAETGEGSIAQGWPTVFCFFHEGEATWSLFCWVCMCLSCFPRFWCPPFERALLRAPPHRCLLLFRQSETYANLGAILPGRLKWGLP